MIPTQPLPRSQPMVDSAGRPTNDFQRLWQEVGGRIDDSATALDATYLTLSANGLLGFERVLTAGTGIAFADAGAGSTLTVRIANTGVTAASYGSTSKTLVATFNAQGQLTNITAPDISITASQINNSTVTGRAVLTATDAPTGLNILLPVQAGNNGRFLTTDGTDASWAVNPLGTVTSVNASGGTTGLSFSGGPITSSGTLTLAGILVGAHGGTGNGFMQFAGPATSAKTFTLPNASAAILTDNQAVTPAQGGTGVSNAGTITIGGSLTFTGAFTFGATLSGNTAVTFPTSGTLATVEQGTFTPAWGGSGGNPTPVYTQQHGYYTKVGRLVTATVEITTSSSAGGSGSLRLTGLPFTSLAGRFTGAVHVGYAFNFTGNAPSGGYIGGGATLATMTYDSSATGIEEAPVSAINTGAACQIVMTIIYQAA